MLDFIHNNYQWIFSGIGVLIVSILINLVFKGKKKRKKLNQMIISGNNSNNIQTFGNINIINK